MSDDTSVWSEPLAPNGTPLRECQFCEAGHLTQIDQGRLLEYWWERSGRRPCQRLVGNGYCRGATFPAGTPEVMAAWILGGPEAAWYLVTSITGWGSALTMHPRKDATRYGWHRADYP